MYPCGRSNTNPHCLSHFSSAEERNWSIIICAPLTKSPNCASHNTYVGVEGVKGVEATLESFGLSGILGLLELLGLLRSETQYKMLTSWLGCSREYPKSKPMTPYSDKGELQIVAFSRLSGIWLRNEYVSPLQKRKYARVDAQHILQEPI